MRGLASIPGCSTRKIIPNPRDLGDLGKESETGSRIMLVLISVSVVGPGWCGGDLPTEFQKSHLQNEVGSTKRKKKK